MKKEIEFDLRSCSSGVKTLSIRDKIQFAKDEYGNNVKIKMIKIEKNVKRA